MSISFPSEKVRLYLYGIVTAVLAVLAAYKLIDPALIPLWLSLAGTVLGIVSSGTAALALTAQRKARKTKTP